jgi:hypothetical protein
VSSWRTVSSILKAYSKFKSKHIIRDGDAVGLAEDCMGFEKAVDDIPVLSAYEEVETRTRRLLTSRTLVLKNTPFRDPPSKFMIVGRENTSNHKHEIGSTT